jgi:hypothetical protein
VQVGVWQHLAATWNANSGELRLYLDGAIRRTLVANITLTGGIIAIGADIDEGVEFAYFPGALDEFRIYTRDLDTAEIVELARTF